MGWWCCGRGDRQPDELQKGIRLIVKGQEHMRLEKLQSYIEEKGWKQEYTEEGRLWQP